MFCTKCGKETKDDLKFCSNCGNQVKFDENDGLIIFERKSQFFGCLVPIKVFLDGREVASLSSGKSAEIPVTIGEHKISFNLWSGNNQYDVNLTKEDKKVKVLFKLSMGLVTNKPEIISIESIK